MEPECNQSNPPFQCEPLLHYSNDSNESFVSYMGFSFPREVWDNECKRIYDSQFDASSKLYKNPIIQEEIIEVPKITVKEEVIEKVQYIPKQKFYVQKVVLQKETTVKVPRTEYKINPIARERIVNVEHECIVPEITYVEKIVDIRLPVTKKRVPKVPAATENSEPEIQEVSSYTEETANSPNGWCLQTQCTTPSKIEKNILQKQIEIPKKVVRIFPVEKIVEVHEQKVKEVPVKVPIIRRNERIKYVPQVLPKYRFIKVEKKIPRPVYFYQAKDEYRHVEVPVFVNKDVFVPVPKLHETVLQDVVHVEVPHEREVYKPHVIKEYVKKPVLYPKLEPSEPLILMNGKFVPYSELINNRCKDLGSSDPANISSYEASNSTNMH